MIKKSGKAKKRRKPIREKESLGGPRITKGKSKGEYGTDPEHRANLEALHRHTGDVGGKLTMEILELALKGG